MNGTIEEDKTVINCMIKIYKRFKKHATCFENISLFEIPLLITQLTLVIYAQRILQVV